MPEPIVSDHMGVSPELVQMIARAARVSADQIDGDTRFDTLGHWTSLTALRLLGLLEKHFGVRLDLREFFFIQTVAELDAAVRTAASS